MWWRVRATLDDRPGSLAALAQACGAAEVDIVALQIFPGLEVVTDELVLRTPRGWTVHDVVVLLEGAGARSVVAGACTEAALADQPTRYVLAARSILERPASFPEVVAALFDADARPTGPTQDLMDLHVGDLLVQVGRDTPFTATEHARGAGLAALVGDVLGRDPAPDPAAAAKAPPDPRAAGSPTYVVSGRALTAVVDGVVVGRAALAAEDPLVPGHVAVTLDVDAVWRRRGIGTRLLVDAARLAAGLGICEVMLTTRADNHAVMPLVLGAGLRGRIRMAGDELTVRIGVRDLRPLCAV